MDEDIATIPTDRWEAARTVPILATVKNSTAKDKYWCQPCTPEDARNLKETVVQRQREGSPLTLQEINMVELLHYYHKFHHMPFVKLKKMAKEGII